MRHLRNINELILYASISCFVTFIARLYPAFLAPITFVRIGIIGYCLWIIATAEGNKILAMSVSVALTVGVIGGNWDYLEVWLKYNQDTLTRFVNIFAFISLLGCGITVYYRSNKL